MPSSMNFVRRPMSRDRQDWWCQIASAGSGVLTAHEFEPRAEELLTADHQLLRWKRSEVWKTEIVQLGRSTRNASTMDANLFVHIRLSDERVLLLDAPPLPRILGESRDYRATSWPFGSRVVTLENQVCADVERAGAWLENYSSPLRALERLDSGKTARGKARNAVIEELWSFLRSFSRDDSPAM